MVLTDNLIAYYDFNDNGSVADRVGSDHSTAVNSATFAATGKIAGGYVFSGAAQTIDFGSSLHTLAKTINIWVKRNNGGADATQIIWSAHTVSNGDPKIQHDSLGSSLVFRIATNGGEFEWATGQSISPNTWTMITMVHDDTNNLLYGYKNGSVFGSTAAAVTHTTQEGTSSRIGGWYAHNNNDYCGSVDELGLWSSTLSASDVATLYNNGSGLTYPFTTGPGFNMKINIGDVWKDVAGVQINIGDTWKTVSGAQINIGDVWKTS